MEHPDGSLVTASTTERRDPAQAPAEEDARAQSEDLRRQQEHQAYKPFLGGRKER